ncbi:MAG: hypothetical protein V3U46_05280 [Acidimicrobiia bacterium]
MQLTGPDYLMLLADKYATEGRPFAALFRRMVGDWMSELSHDSFRRSVVDREMKDHEKAPVAVIIGAVMMTQDRNESESLAEAISVGLELLAKWPDYLVGEGHNNEHPDFARAIS